MSTNAATLPERAGSRDEALRVLAGLSADLAGEVVRVDGSRLVAGSSSFMDELVKQVLAVRGADGLVLDGITSRAAAFAESSALRRHVADRLTATVRPR